ncbi:PVC-type heme-binding CxxCH protein [Pollutibacter soli]|uniref:PVC-type heme-binding CxxCH protein n=1 Tax=Pollutibacter soli TaxID=3034157 RepID=UPI0030139511
MSSSSLRIPAVAYLLSFIFIFSCTQKGKDHNQTGLVLPDDLEATLWAETPLLYNPTNIDVDGRGRVWVTEAVNYRNFKNDSLHHLHRNGGDRVVILEDTDGDGHADTSKVFVQDSDLVAPVGLAVIGNKVYVSCSPNLIVYTDTNGDDKPDSKEIFLTGFGGFDHDHSLHAVYGGANGALYFNTGNAGPHIVKDKSGFTLRSGSMYTGGTPYNKKNEAMISDDGSKWVGGLALQIQPDGTKLKVLGHNFRNAYEVFPDSYGNLWQNDNDDQVLTCRFSWIPESGNAGYFSTDGSRSWQADQRPGQDMFTAHWHQDDPGIMPAGFNTGAGSPTGVLRIENSELGEKYRGMLLSVDAGRNVVFGFNAAINGSGLMPVNKQNLVTSLPADNELYVWDDSSANSNKTNWFRPSDAALGTDGALFIADWYDPVVGGHQMNDSLGYGRIYRITPKNKKLTSPQINLETVDGQVKALANPAIHVRYLAAARLRNEGDKANKQLSTLVNGNDPFLAARAIWILAAGSDDAKKMVHLSLQNKDPMLRATALRALRYYGVDIKPMVTQLQHDSSAFVRRELIVAIKDSGLSVKRELLVPLIKSYKTGDRWYLDALGQAMDDNSSWWYDTLQQVYSVSERNQWPQEMSDLAWRLHSSNASDDIAKRALDSTLPVDKRQQMLTALAFIPTKESVDYMLQLSKSPDSTIAADALYWLSFRQGNEWLALTDWSKIPLNTAAERKKAILKVKQQIMMDERQSDYERRAGVRSLALDSVGGKQLIAMVAGETLPAKLSKFVQEFIFYNPDAAVRIQAGRYFTRPGQVKSYNIDSILMQQPDAAKGKLLFQQNCTVCHKAGDIGNSIAPDLTKISKKMDPPTLLDAIVNPNGAIVFGYEPWLANTKDGQSIYGFLVSQDSNFVVIKDISGEQHRLKTTSITSLKKQDKGLMPDPGSMGLTNKDLADITGYLKSMAN